MKIINIPIKDDSYNVYIKRELLFDISSYILTIQGTNVKDLPPYLFFSATDLLKRCGVFCA